MTELWMFVGALAVAYLVPGPDMLLLLQTAASHSSWQSAGTIAGLALARAAHVALAGLGLAALLQTAPWAFNAVRLFGAVYLIWLGVSIWRASSLVPVVGAARRSPTVWAAFWRGAFDQHQQPQGAAVLLGAATAVHRPAWRQRGVAVHPAGHHFAADRCVL